MSIIEVRNLKKSFGDVKVLDGVSFAVEKGEAIAVIGPSGSGKSTMLRCLIGLERADGGDIIIEGSCKMVFMSLTHKCVRSVLKWVWCFKASTCFHI